MNNPYQIRAAVQIVEDGLSKLSPRAAKGSYCDVISMRYLTSIETTLVLCGFLPFRSARKLETITENKKVLFFKYTKTRKETYAEFIIRQAKLFLENKTLIASDNYKPPTFLGNSQLI